MNSTPPSAKALVFGVDPGLSGAIAWLVDGKFGGVFDMPTRERKNGKREIDGYALGRLIRAEIASRPGASVAAAIEDVSARPSRGSGKICPACGQEEQKAGGGMGVSGALQFGRSAGGVQYAFEALGVPVTMVVSSSWKRQTGLDRDKDESRRVAAECFPGCADLVKLKKHDGRAEAILIARWGDRHQLGRDRSVPDDPFDLKAYCGVTT